MKFRLLDLVLAAMADPGRSPAETLAFLTRRAALQARRDLSGGPLEDETGGGDMADDDTLAGFELGFAAALRASEQDGDE